MNSMQSKLLSIDNSGYNAIMLCSVYWDFQTTCIVFRHTCIWLAYGLNSVHDITPWVIIIPSGSLLNSKSSFGRIFQSGQLCFPGFIETFISSVVSPPLGLSGEREREGEEL